MINKCTVETENSKKARRICGITFFAAAVIGIMVCSIVDFAVNNAFTWSLYPISSILFACAVASPIMLCGFRGMIPALGVFTVLLLPFMFVLDRITGTDGVILRVGGVVSAIALVYLWLICLIMKLCRHRMWMGFGIALILAAPLCVLINYSLSVTLTPEAGAFDMWDILDIVILTAGGIGLIAIDLFLERTKKRKTKASNKIQNNSMEVFNGTGT